MCGRTPLTMHVREARAQDVGALAELATQLGYPSHPEEVLHRLRCVVPERSRVLVAVVDACVVGWVHVSLYPTLVTDGAAQIHGLVVDQKWRDRGIGRALLEAAESWALDRACRTMLVRSNVIRREAHDFYRHLGYQQGKTSVTFAKVLGGEH